MCKKSARRKEILDSIIGVISNKEIYDTIDYKNRGEDFIKQFMYAPLVNGLAEMYEKTVSKKTAIEKAKASLVWEANKQTTLHNMVMFGTQHRPDMEIAIDGVNIAIEVKKGENGNDVRSGLGQCMVYQSKYDFVIFLLIDTSSDKRILNSMTSTKEAALVDSLWENYNTIFKTV